MATHAENLLIERINQAVRFLSSAHDPKTEDFYTRKILALEEELRQLSLEKVQKVVRRKRKKLSS